MTGLPDLQALFEAAQKVQAEMARVKQGLAERTVTGEAGGGMVRCVVNGKGEIVSLDIDPSLFTFDGDPAVARRMVADLVVGAANLALDRSRELSERELAAAAGGMLPPGVSGR